MQGVINIDNPRITEWLVRYLVSYLNDKKANNYETIYFMKRLPTSVWLVGPCRENSLPCIDACRATWLSVGQ